MNKETLNFMIIFFITFFSMQFIQFYFAKETVQEIIEASFIEAEKPPVELIEQNFLKTINLGPFTLDFDEISGNLINLHLNDFFTTQEKKQEIATLFKNGFQQQTLSNDILLLNNKSHQIDKITYDRVEFSVTKDNDSLIVKRINPFVTMIETYKLDANRNYSLLKNIELEAKELSTLYLYSEFKNTNQAVIEGTEEGSRMFQGASFHTESLKYKKIPFKQFAKSAFSQQVERNGWFAVSQRYFTSALFVDYPGKFYTKFSSINESCITGHLSKEIVLKAGEQASLKQRFYSGPEQKEALKAFAPAFELVIDYGFFWPICGAILSVLTLIHQFFQNWGVAIILATIGIRLALIGLTKKQMKTMKKMQLLQPKIEMLKKIHHQDQIALSQEMMALYKTEGMNPLTSFFSAIMTPIIQIPIFFAFYSVLMETVDLRQAPFLGWIVDLSLKDPYYVLPILVGLSAYIQQRLSPKPQDETMAMMMNIMPLFLGVFCINLPAGLGLYWMTNNVFSVIQAWSTNRGQVTQ
jgi:YidC/Oxa1 family membrane protein insertase